MKLLLLHGALGAPDQLAALKNRLSEKFDVVCPALPGHGTNSETVDFSIANFASWLLNMEELQNGPFNIVGYSMGGYISIYIARHYPELVGRVITLATKYRWDEAIAAGEIKMLDADKIATKIPAFAKSLEERHTGIGWRPVLKNTARLMTGMGANNPLTIDDFKSISTPSLVAIGDRDKMVSLDETLEVYQSLPQAQLCVLPGTGHPIEQVDADMFSAIALNFLAGA